MSDTKKWWESKTIWTNVITLLAIVDGQLLGWQELSDYAPSLIMISNLLNILLRVITTMPIR